MSGDYWSHLFKTPSQVMGMDPEERQAARMATEHLLHVVAKGVEGIGQLLWRAAADESAGLDPANILNTGQLLEELGSVMFELIEAEWMTDPAEVEAYYNRAMQAQASKAQEARA